MDLSRKVSNLDTFAAVAEEKITHVENRLAEAERKIKELEIELKKLKAKS